MTTETIRLNSGFKFRDPNLFAELFAVNWVWNQTELAVGIHTTLVLQDFSRVTFRTFH